MSLKNIVILLLFTVTIFCSSSPLVKCDVTIYYERRPWFVDHDMAQTVDRLIEHTLKDMENPDESTREFQLLRVKNFDVPDFTQTNEESWKNTDCFCAILIKKGDKADTLCFSKAISDYFYNGYRVSDCLYVQNVIDYLCKKDVVFLEETRHAKELFVKIRPDLFSW